VRKHGASTASRRAAPPSARFQRDRPEVGGVTHIVVVYDIWLNMASSTKPGVRNVTYRSGARGGPIEIWPHRQQTQKIW